MFDLQTPKQPSEDAIIVSNVSKHFRIPHEKKTKLFEHITGVLKGTSSTYEEFWAVKDVSFTVKRGETLGIIGENGSGKSTLLKIITGVLTPDSGSVKVNGKIAPFLELGVGFNPELTAEDNVRLYGAIMGMSKNEMEAKFEEIFEFAELPRFRNMKLKNFSSGMYARLAFATATATDPDILLIDEALSVGDVAFQRKCFKRISDYRTNGKTILLVSHSMGAIRDNCGRSIFLHKGMMIRDGDSNKVIASYSGPADLLNDMKSSISIENLRQVIKPSKLTIETFEPALEALKQSEDIKITEARIMDESGNERNSFNTGEKSIVKIAYETKKKIDDPCVGFGIFREDGVRVFSDFLEVKCLNRKGSIEIELLQLQLLKGQYNLDFTICLDHRWDKPLCYYRIFYGIVIQNQTNESGIVSIPHSWKSF
jgi:lipopolysaccharide transport system ATP-binding protein